ncbi:MAG: O-antigen ligase family protein [Chloroflexi bacterium]|nr:O-antigen ligase family protein [Chloroflexota bacterium]
MINRDNPLRLTRSISLSLSPIFLLILLYFCQVWWEVGGVTVRAEDILSIALLFNMLLPSFLRLKLRYRRSLLNGPILLWMVAIAFSVLVTIVQPFDSVTKKDALVNGVRVVLAFSTFFIMYNHPAPARAKIETILQATIWFSFITTAVSLLQIGYWDGWLPVSLPAMLIEQAPGANVEKGREIFALFIGDTGTHTWSGMLAFQALTVFLYARIAKNSLKRWSWFGYFGLLTLILLRTAVRNSLLGLLVAIACLSFLKSRYLVNRVLKFVFLVLLGATLMLTVVYLNPDNYFVQRALAMIPQIDDGQIVVSRASHFMGRIYYAKISLRLFQLNPLLGHGFFSYQTTSTLVSPNPMVHAHNLYLQILVELGLIGAAVFGWLTLRIIKFLRYLRSLKPSAVSIVLGRDLLVSSVISIGFTALFANLLWYSRRVGFLALLLGALATYRWEIYLRDTPNDS